MLYVNTQERQPKKNEAIARTQVLFPYRLRREGVVSV